MNSVNQKKTLKEQVLSYNAIDVYVHLNPEILKRNAQTIAYYVSKHGVKVTEEDVQRYLEPNLEEDITDIKTLFNAYG